MENWAELGRRIENTAEERRIKNTTEEGSVPAGRRAGVTRPGAGATRRERHQDRRRGRRVQEWKRRQEGQETPPAKVSKMTFLTDMMEKGYIQEEIFAILFESKQDRKRRRMQAIEIETVDAHRLRKVRDLLDLKKLATWRRMNGFDRVADGEDNWFHARSLPPTPQEFSASLRPELQKLKDAISIPRQKVSNLINEIEEGKVDNEEFAILKWLAEKRSRGVAQAQVTARPVDTVHHCSPCPLDPEPSPDVCVKLESNKGRMDPERGELESSSAGMGLETPGQQCPPNEGM